MKFLINQVILISAYLKMNRCKKLQKNLNKHLMKCRKNQKTLLLWKRKLIQCVVVINLLLNVLAYYSSFYKICQTSITCISSLQILTLSYSIILLIIHSHMMIYLTELNLLTITIHTLYTNTVAVVFSHVIKFYYRFTCVLRSLSSRIKLTLMNICSFFVVVRYLINLNNQLIQIQLG